MRPWALAGALVLAAASARADYKEIEVKDGASIFGKVTFTGALPADAVEEFAVASSTEVCGKERRQLLHVDVKGGALRGTFVFLDGIAEGKKWPAPKPGGYLIDQKGCHFVPGTQVVRKGPITVRNSDPILHNVNLRELIGVETGRVVKRSAFNVAQPARGSLEQLVRSSRSIYFAVGCDIHNFMLAHLLAPEHPYATVVAEDGSWTLADVPPGTWTVKAWHPKLGVKQTTVTVVAKGKATAAFEFGK